MVRPTSCVSRLRRGNVSFWTAMPAMMWRWSHTARLGMRFVPWMSGWNDCRVRNRPCASRRITCASPSNESTHRSAAGGDGRVACPALIAFENAAEIAEGVNRALSALDASQVVDDVESSSATDLIDRASQALRAIHVDGVFSELADRLDSISTDLSDVVFTLSGEVDNDLGMEDLDAINGRIHELDELVRRWGPELSDVIAWRDQAVFDLEDLDASPEKVSQLQAEREKLFGEALKRRVR